ncbi:HYC_CC_PP family protein [Flavobacterium luminosum]|uniref:Uncharacterized protein n=1 Tax=Flavobacterium luminosum TaxID=2949086 RepID=A0ABT0TKE0_9FLAO|nr:hypothetical protein [Flavobacterium sp. HXWNR70]MCL9807965.1 hypothetical protein [Flavobacterium sp. HXWNR70]
MKFKVQINIILAVLILVSNVGLAFNVHYCGDKIAGISFDYKISDPCDQKKNEEEKSCCAKKKKESSCCKNNKIEIEKTTSENVLIKSFQLDLTSYILVHEYQSLSFPLLKEVVKKNENPSFYCDTHAPPLYKLYSQYIFYA